MATTAIRKQIKDDLVATLRAITKTDGYNFTISTEQVTDHLMTIEMIEGAKMPFYTVSIMGETVDKAASGKLYRGTLDMRIQGWVQSKDFDELDAELEKVLWDARKKVMESITRNGLACETKIMSIANFEGDLSHLNLAMFEMYLSVWYDYASILP